MSWLELTSITIVTIGMTHVVGARLTLPYHMLCSFILSLLLICFPFHSIVFYSISNRFNSIRFDWIWFTIFSSISVFDFLFFSPLLSYLFCHERLPHTHIHGHKHTCAYTDTHIHMNICFFLWLVHITSKGCTWRIILEWLYYLIFDLIR